MAIYNNFRELKGNILSNGDKVVFSFDKNEIQVDVRYTVGSKYLVCSHESNSYIFDKLQQASLTERGRFEICREAYGYEPEDGQWPECLEKDLGALTRAVLSIYKIIESGSVQKVDDVHIVVKTPKLVSKFYNPKV